MEEHKTTWVKAAGTAGIACPVTFGLVVLVMGFVHPSYSHLQNFISDLGALDAPNPWPQRLNFFQLGLGVLVLGVGLSATLRPPPRALLSMQALIGLGIFLSGMFPGHAADATSLASLLHGVVGMPAFLLIITLPFIAGRRFMRDDEWRRLSVFSMALSPLLLTLFVLMAWADGSPERSPGVFQRLFLGTWMVWMIAVGTRLRSGRWSTRQI